MKALQSVLAFSCIRNPPPQKRRNSWPRLLVTGGSAHSDGEDPSTLLMLDNSTLGVWLAMGSQQTWEGMMTPHQDSRVVDDMQPLGGSSPAPYKALYRIWMEQQNTIQLFPRDTTSHIV